LKLSFSRHARAKLGERQIGQEKLTSVLQNPREVFYDATSLAQVAIRQVDLHGIGVDLVVIFRRRDGAYHIVTAYPVKDVRGEVERKVNSGRWVPI